MNSPVVPKTPWGSFVLVTLAYVVATLAGAVTLHFSNPQWHGLVKVAVADFTATLVVFAFSRALNNTSVYDPYWSVAPLAIAAWLVWGPGDARGLDARQVLVFSLVTFYAIRLTYNWVRGWSGLRHEDWRYVAFRESMGRGYWFFSLAGLHLMPTVLVFIGVMPLYPALVTAAGPLNALDLIAAVVTFLAVVIEGVADNQLRAFRADPSHAQQICDVGLWAFSRHPNYFGEISFWFGLMLFGFAADAPWWMASGTLVMIALFVGATIPLAEKRSLARRPAYAEHQRRVSMLVPWFRKGA